MKQTWDQVFQDYLAKLENCGWLKDLPDFELISLKNRLQRGEYEPETPSKYEIFNIYQRLAVVEFDVECIIGPGDGYRQILEEMVKASWGKFIMENYAEKWNETEETIDLSFTFKGKQFAATIPMDEDWFHEDAVTLVNQALKEFNIEQQFIDLPSAEQTAYYTFISENTYSKAVEQGVIPTEEQVLEFEIS